MFLRNYASRDVYLLLLEQTEPCPIPKRDPNIPPKELLISCFHIIKMIFSHLPVAFKGNIEFLFELDLAFPYFGICKLTICVLRVILLNAFPAIKIRMCKPLIG